MTIGNGKEFDPTDTSANMLADASVNCQPTVGERVRRSVGRIRFFTFQYHYHYLLICVSSEYKAYY